MLEPAPVPCIAVHRLEAGGNEKNRGGSNRAIGSRIYGLLFSNSDGAAEIVAETKRDVNEAIPKAFSRFGFCECIFKGCNVVVPDVIKTGPADKGGSPRTKEDRFTAATAAAVKIMSRHQRSARGRTGYKSVFADAFAP